METSSTFTNNNEAAVPLHPMVPNPYTLLSEIPQRDKYFSVIDFPPPKAQNRKHLSNQLLRSIWVIQEFQTIEYKD